MARQSGVSLLRVLLQLEWCVQIDKLLSDLMHVFTDEITRSPPSFPFSHKSCSRANKSLPLLFTLLVL